MTRRNSLSRWTVCLLGLLFGAVMIPHPVMAAKKCLDCHKDAEKLFSSYKYQHPATKDEQCETCHKRHGFAQQLILQDDSNQLCYSCHEDLEAEYTSGHVHFPVAEGRCWDCHDPHGADKEFHLRTGPEGANDPASCLICHKEDVASALNAEVPHAPFTDQDCTTCHDAHNSAVPGLLVKAPTDLCSDCHDRSAESFVAAHDDKNTSALACTDCHSGHASDMPGLLSENTHAPFAGGDCEMCHSRPAADGSIVFEEGMAGSASCAVCHDDVVAKTESEHPHAAVAGDNCLDCHDPHSSRFSHLLTVEERELCMECHSDVLSASGKTPHLPAMLGQCSSCHDVHGGDHPQLVKATDAELCTGCHADYLDKQATAGSVHAAIGECQTCHAPHEGLTEHVLRDEPKNLCADCHEPEEAALEAPSGHQPYLTGDCVGCHSPHFSDEAHLVRGDDQAMCLSCHADIKNRVNMSVPHAPATDDCRTCHQPHYADTEPLLTSKQGELCGTCHDYEDLHVTAEFVHTPAREGDCSGCHNPHGGVQEKLVTGRMTKINVNGRMVGQLPRLSGKTSDLCYTCHDDLVETFRKQGAHQPVVEGACETCHAAHGSDQPAFLVASAPDVCATCHTLDAELSAQHGGYDLATTDCLSCHNPHVSDNPKLVRTLIHAPFDDKTGCDACHEKAADGTPELVASQSELCGMCHEDINEAAGEAHQHVPFAMEECSACHGVHASDHPGLLKAEGSRLCFSCHEDVRDQQALRVSHEPFSEGDCLSCHRPHASQNAGLLTKPNESFCVSCHTDLDEQLKAGSPHAPVVDGECSACHEPHAGEHQSLLTSTKEDLCGTCHDLASPALSQAHGGFAIAEANCQNCHTSHVSPPGVAGLLLPDSHAPFAVGDCSTCHEGTSVQLVAGSVREQCLVCHDLEADLGRAVVHSPVKSDDGCTGCHGPHVGYGASLQVRQGVETCLECHDTPEFTGAVQHEIAFDDCSTCHQPHSADYKGLLDSPDIQQLCLNCHDNALETHYHPMGEGVINPLTKTTLTCVGCHSPHSSPYQALLVADRDRKLCVVCHNVSH